ncbi:hypothetical protein [Cryobacterium sp. N21]|uniref:hypothetical protein n=1 Tax=Cryobacterium sp. N21 TaxID=2048289 RepID=UPI001124D7DE|nr:hypothetical protein [Cryobacterium sp. N21]
MNYLISIANEREIGVVGHDDCLSARCSLIKVYIFRQQALLAMQHVGQQEVPALEDDDICSR